MSKTACAHLGYIGSPVVMCCLLLLICTCRARAAEDPDFDAVKPYWLLASLT